MRALMTTSDRLGALIATGAGKRAGGTLSKARVAADWETRGSHSPTGHVLETQSNNETGTGAIRGLTNQTKEFRLSPDRFDRVSAKNPMKFAGFIDRD